MEVKAPERRFGKQLSQALSTRGPLAFGLGSLVLRRALDRDMDSFFKQTGSVHLDRAAVGGGLTRKRGLNLGCDVNGDCHGRPSKSYGTAACVSNQHDRPSAGNPLWPSGHRGPLRRQQRYSYRKASMGSRRAALIAGSSPAIRPMVSSNAVEVITANVEICRRISPDPLVWWNRGPNSGRLPSTAVTAQPAATPMMPPTVTIATASSRNCARMERRVAPMDFNMPISRVRCVTETSMMLASPTPPMASVSVPMKPSSRRSAIPMVSTIRMYSLKTMVRTARSSLGEKLCRRAIVSLTCLSASSRKTGLTGIQTMSSGYFKSRYSDAVSYGMKAHALSGVL